MTFQKIDWQEYYSEKEQPNWKCPGCKKAILLLNKSTTLQNSLVNDPYYHLDPTEITFNFLHIFKCPNTLCSQEVVVTGEKTVTEYEYFEPEDLIKLEYQQMEDIKNYKDKFFPKFIIPHVEILSENENIPFNILQQIEKVNQLFWADKSGCANKIRIVIEEILTYKKVPKTFLNKKSRRARYNLNQRIELIDEKFPKLFNHLSAIRIIGNKGSHSSEIDNEMVLDAIQILNETLKFLFFDNTKELDSIIKSHLKNKIKKK